MQVYPLCLPFSFKYTFIKVLVSKILNDKLLELIHFAVGWNKVSGFAFDMARTGNPTDSLVKFGVTKSRVYLDTTPPGFPYSVKEYADWLLAHTEDNADYAKAAPLVKAMLNYGANSQLYFDKNTGTLANAGLTNEEKALGDVEITIADPVIEILPEGTTFIGATLSLKSETTLSLYFTSSADLTFSCGNYTVETATKGGYQIARIRGIKAADIGKILTLNFSGGTVSGGSVSYSPLNYCKYVLADNMQNENLQNAVKALYLYWQAAADYFSV